MKNKILHCGICGNLLDMNISTLECLPVVKNPSNNIDFDRMRKLAEGLYEDPHWYNYVVLPCYCQYDNKKITKYYLTAEAWYELIRLSKKEVLI